MHFANNFITFSYQQTRWRGTWWIAVGYFFAIFNSFTTGSGLLNKFFLNSVGILYNKSIFLDNHVYDIDKDTMKNNDVFSPFINSHWNKKVFENKQDKYVSLYNDPFVTFSNAFTENINKILLHKIIKNTQDFVSKDMSKTLLQNTHDIETQVTQKKEKIIPFVVDNKKSLFAYLPYITNNLKSFISKSCDINSKIMVTMHEDGVNIQFYSSKNNLITVNFNKNKRWNYASTKAKTNKTELIYNDVNIKKLNIDRNIVVSAKVNKGEKITLIKTLDGLMTKIIKNNMLKKEYADLVVPDTKSIIQSKIYHNTNQQSILPISIKKFILPVLSGYCSSKFNERRFSKKRRCFKFHKGVDYAAKIGTPVLATMDGKIVKIERRGAYGLHIKISHNGSIATLYAHLNNLSSNIIVGKSVKQGQIIGYVGRTGNATGAHLHYELIVNGVHKNPELFTNSSLPLRCGRKNSNSGFIPNRRLSNRKK